MNLQKDLTESTASLSNSNNNSMSEYRRVIPINDKIIEDINLEDNERGECDEISEHKKDNEDIKQYLQLLIQKRNRSETMDNLLYIYEQFTYANVKSTTRWFLENASVSFTFSVPLCTSEFSILLLNIFCVSCSSKILF